MESMQSFLLIAAFIYLNAPAASDHNSARRRPTAITDSTPMMVVDGGVPSPFIRARHPGVVGPAGAHELRRDVATGDSGAAVHTAAPDATWGVGEPAS